MSRRQHPHKKRLEKGYLVSKNSKLSPLTRDAVRQFLSQNTFRLTPRSETESSSSNVGLVGVEIEMLPLRGKDYSGIPQLQGQQESILSWILPLGDELKWKQKTEPKENSPGQVVVTLLELPEGDNVSFEPGGQVEISSKPYASQVEMVSRVRQLRTQITTALGFHGVNLVGIGYNPIATTDQVGLQMAKKRYRAMDAYFETIGPYGRQMMRQTCTVQVCLDFGSDQETMAKRFWVGQMIAPIAAAIFANSPIVNRKPAGIVGHRSKIWRNIDSSRTGLLFPKSKLMDSLTAQACVETYERFLLESKVIFIQALDYEVPKNLTFGTWLAEGYKGIFPNEADLELALSLLFSEVRPRGFFEFRSVDNQHPVWQFVPTVFWSTLMYSEGALNQAWELLAPLQSRLPELLKRSEQGLKDPELSSLSQRLVAIVEQHLETLPTAFRDKTIEHDFRRFCDRYTLKGRTPGDELIELLGQSQGDLGSGFWSRLNEKLARGM